MAAWAAITTRIRIGKLIIGTLITNLSWAHRCWSLWDVAAIDQVSGGRFELGLAPVRSAIRR